MHFYFQFLVLILLFPHLLLGQLEGEWFEKANMPTARKEIANAAVALDGKIYVVGGRLNGNQIGNTFERYDPLTNTWTTLTPYPITVWRATAAVANGQIYVFGGYQVINPFPFNPTNRVFCYHPSTDEWTEQANMLVPRGASVAVTLEDKIHLIGGASNTALSTHHLYDPTENEWTTVAPLSEARSGLTANVIDGKIYVCGGYFLSNGVVSRSTTEVYDSITEEWTFAENMPIARLGLSSAVVDGKLYVFGGETNAAVPSKTLEYDPQSDSWRQMTNIPETVNFAGAAAVKDSIFLMGGGAVNLTDDGINKTFCFIPKKATGIKTALADNIHLKILPNPLEANGILEVVLDKKIKGSIEIFNAKTQLIKTLFQGELSKGKHQLNLKRTDLPQQGLYYVVFRNTNAIVKVKKLLVD